MKNVVIAPRSFHDYLKKCYQKDYIFNNAKFFSLEDIMTKVFGEVSANFIETLLIEKNISYFKAKKFIRYIPFIKDIPFKDDLYDAYLLALENGVIIKDEYVDVLLNANIDVYGYQHDDRFLIYLKNKFNLTLNFKKIELSNNTQYLLEFDTCEDEILFLFNEIRKLYDEGVSLNDIFIYGVNRNNKDLIYKYAKRYKIPFNCLDIFETEKSVYYRDFFSYYNETKNIDESCQYVLKLYEGDNLAKDIISFLLENVNDKYSFKTQLDVFNNVIKDFHPNGDKFSPAITFMSELKLIEDKYLFVLDFSTIDYPKVSLDNDYLNDEFKSRNYIYTSKEKNINNKNELLTFLKMNNMVYLMFAYKHLDNNFYLSYLVDELNVLKQKNKDDYDYSLDSLNLKFAKLKDVERKYGKHDGLLNSLEEISNVGYKNYSPDYSKVNAILEKQELRLSFSGLNIYDECPFKYYLSNVLKVNDLDDAFNMELGSLAHYIFEKCLNNIEQFDSVFLNAKTHFTFNEKQNVIIDNLKDYLKAAMIAINEHYNEMNNPQVYVEKACSFKLDDVTTIKGKIDKAIITESNDNKYLWLVDYKTGNNKISLTNILKGDNLQLPTYVLLASKDNELKHFTLGGFYYNNVLPKHVTNPAKKPDLKYLKLEGLTVKSITAINSFEPHYSDNEKSIYLNIASYDDGKAFNKVQFIDENNVNQIKEIVLNSFINFNKNLRDNNFEIKPKSPGMHGSCGRCKYHDICFYKERK